jgi:hypothetical protein
MPSEQVIYRNADGVTVDLHDLTHTFLLQGRSGQDGAAVRLSQQALVNDFSYFLRSLSIDERTVKLPVLIIGGNAYDLRQRKRDIESKLNALKGAGWLEVTDENGVTRKLKCRYTGGMTQSNRNPNTELVNMAFEADDPFWVGAVQQTIITSTIVRVPFLSSQFLPLRISKADVYGSANIVNSGDTTMWPLITINGPGSNPIISNTDSGKMIQINITLAQEDVIQINTKPLIKSILLNGENARKLGIVALKTALFGLEMGDNNLQVQMASTSAQTQIIFSYQERFHVS